MLGHTWGLPINGSIWLAISRQLLLGSPGKQGDLSLDFCCQALGYNFF